MSQPASLSGAAYSRTAATTSSLNVSPDSIRGTSLGQATAVRLHARIQRLRKQLVAPAGHGQLGREQADAAVACRLHGRVRLGDDHRHDGHLQLLLEIRERDRGRRVARDDDHLHPQAFEVEADLVREPLHLVARPRAVREARMVAEIDEILVRHRHEALVQNGEAPDSRVEDADRARIHRERF